MSIFIVRKFFMLFLIYRVCVCVMKTFPMILNDVDLNESSDVFFIIVTYEL